MQPAAGTVDAQRQVPVGVRLPAEEPLLHHAQRLDVLVWRPVAAG